MTEGALTEADIVKAVRDEGVAFELTPSSSAPCARAPPTASSRRFEPQRRQPRQPQPRRQRRTRTGSSANRRSANRRSANRRSANRRSAYCRAAAGPGADLGRSAAGPGCARQSVGGVARRRRSGGSGLARGSPGVAFAYDSAAHAALEAAGAGPRLLTSSAALSLRSPGFGGDFEALEALVKARVSAADLLAELRRQPLEFPVTITSMEALRRAGAAPELESGLVDIALGANQDPLSLEILEAALTVQYDSVRLSRALDAWGVAFPPTAESQGALRAAGASPEMLDRIVAKWMASSSEPLSLEEILNLWELGAADEVLIETLSRRRASFPVTDANAARFNDQTLSDALRQAAIAAALEEQGFQRMPARQAADYDPFAADGRFDLRIHVDKVEEVYIIGDLVLRKALDGAPSSNAGTELKQAIPRRPIADGSFTVEQVSGRGKIAVMARPSPENGFLFKVRIYDEKGGADLYHLRLSWRR